MRPAGSLCLALLHCFVNCLPEAFAILPDLHSRYDRFGPHGTRWFDVWSKTKTVQ
jgi:hypothetical protein